MPSANCFPHIVTLKTKSTPSPLTASAPTWSTTYASVSALVAPASSDRRNFYDRRNLTITHTIFTSKQIGVSMGDIVVFGSRQFSVKGIQNILESGRLYQIDALEITGTEDVVED